MSKPAWTPGPWNTEAGDSVINVLHGTERVAATNTKPYWKKYDERDVANARLIAAAPELYEALKAFMFADGHDDFEDEWPAARAAIAKAEGRQP